MVVNIHQRFAHVEHWKRNFAALGRAGPAEAIRQKFIHDCGDCLAALGGHPLHLRQSSIIQDQGSALHMTYHTTEGRDYRASATAVPAAGCAFFIWNGVLLTIPIISDEKW